MSDVQFSAWGSGAADAVFGAEMVLVVDVHGTHASIEPDVTVFWTLGSYAPWVFVELRTRNVVYFSSAVGVVLEGSP